MNSEVSETDALKYKSVFLVISDFTEPDKIQNKYSSELWELANALNGAGKQTHLLGRLGCRKVTPKKCCAHERCDAIINVQSERHTAEPCSWVGHSPELLPPHCSC
jgi:hypothetical protein